MMAQKFLEMHHEDRLGLPDTMEHSLTMGVQSFFELFRKECFCERLDCGIMYVKMVN